MIRSLLHQVSVVSGRVPRHLPVGGHDPQQDVCVTLHGLDSPLDVTRNHVVVALRPLTVAFALPSRYSGRSLSSRCRLTFTAASERDAVLGEVGLSAAGTVQIGDVTFHLFERRSHTLDCMPWSALRVFRAHHRWSEWRRRHRRNFSMRPRDLEAHQVLYICPRPVVLVTVQHQQASNLFPMDLIGPTASPYFLMALRNTSPAVRLMTASRRMALADVPLEHAADAYRLGEHHEKERIDWASLPFPTRRSPQYGLPVLENALRVREVEVHDVQAVGSHTLFVTRIVNEERRRSGLQMMHVSGPYYRYLALRGAAPVRP